EELAVQFPLHPGHLEAVREKLSGGAWGRGEEDEQAERDEQAAVRHGGLSWVPGLRWCVRNILDNSAAALEASGPLARHLPEGRRRREGLEGSQGMCGIGNS